MYLLASDMGNPLLLLATVFSIPKLRSCCFSGMLFPAKLSLPTPGTDKEGLDPDLDLVLDLDLVADRDLVLIFVFDREVDLDLVFDRDLDLVFDRDLDLVFDRDLLVTSGNIDARISEKHRKQAGCVGGVLSGE